jgi:hypothetical protein
MKQVKPSSQQVIGSVSVKRKESYLSKLKKAVTFGKSKTQYSSREIGIGDKLSFTPPIKAYRMQNQLEINPYDDLKSKHLIQIRRQRLKQKPLFRGDKTTGIEHFYRLKMKVRSSHNITYYYIKTGKNSYNFVDFEVAKSTSLCKTDDQLQNFFRSLFIESIIMLKNDDTFIRDNALLEETMEVTASRLLVDLTIIPLRRPISFRKMYLGNKVKSKIGSYTSRRISKLVELEKEGTLYTRDWWIAFEVRKKIISIPRLQI